MTEKFLNPAFCQKVILCSLLVIVPYAITFTPFDRFAADENTFAPLEADPQNPIRTALITGGIVASIITVAILLWQFKRYRTMKQWEESELILHLSMAFCSWTLGWMIMPYWANGIYHAYTGNLPESMTLSNLDPKALFPSIAMGGIWELGVLILALSTLCALPVLFFANLAFTIRNKAWKKGLTSLICLVITAGLYLLSPGYFTWLID